MLSRRSVLLSASLSLLISATALGATPASADALDPPTNVRTVDLTANYTTLAWDEPPGDIHDYIVNLYRGPDFDDRWTFRTVDPSATLFLFQGDTYQVEVRATSRDPFAVSEFTERFEFTAPVDPDQPRVPAPTNVRVTDITATSATLAWDAPLPDVPGIRYGIWWSAGSSNLEHDGSDEESVTLSLWPGDTFQARIRVEGMYGPPGDFSEEIEFSTPAVPPPTTPENVRTETAPGQVTVSWDPSHSGLEVRDYVVKTFNDSYSDLRAVTGTEATVEIPPGGRFDVTVTARDTRYHASEPSQPVEATIPEADDWAPPSAPQNLRVETGPYYGDVIVADPPQVGLGRLTYRLYADGIEEPVSVGPPQVTVFDLPFIVDALKSGETYTFRMTASSFGVEGPRSNPVTVTLPTM